MSLDENAALIEPRKGKREAPLPAASILAFTTPDVEMLLRRFVPPARKTHTVCLSQVHVGAYGGTAVSLVGPALGAPQTVMVLEKLIALGVREVMAMGWCGSLQHHVAIGDVVLPSDALSEEGTSVHYPVSPEGDVSCPELVKTLRETLAQKDLRFHEGCVWSTDAPYRETVGKVLAYQRQGVLAVDMETSALLTLARFRRVSIAIALVVSDDLSSLKWVHGFRVNAFHETREKLASVLLEALCGSGSSKTFRA